MKDRIEVIHIRTTTAEDLQAIINRNLDDRDKLISVVAVGSHTFYIIVCRAEPE